MNTNNRHHRSILQGIAHRAMLERDLLPDFSAEALAELGKLRIHANTGDGPAKGQPEIRDLRSLPWSSIDNDDSRDLDQLTMAEGMPDSARLSAVSLVDFTEKAM